MFTDEAEVYLKAGNGGNGSVSFRREKYIPNGGPDGGDGGRGGDIYIEVDSRLRSLAFFNRQKKFLAESGENGHGKKMHGKNAQDLILKVPTGTVIYEKENQLSDLVNDGEKILVVKGGNGGWGNQHFATSIKQAPEWAKGGMRGESKKIKLVFKTIADVGLIGLPNAGKSTLLATLTSARPKIADYPFTTLEPNLGTYVGDKMRIIFADIPGLIEGASEGKGLGEKFLRHIERTRLLIHLLDANSDDLLNDYKTIRNEIKKFSKELTKKKVLVVLNKIDTVSEDDLEEKTQTFKKAKIPVIAISAATSSGIDNLVNKIKQFLNK